MLDDESKIRTLIERWARAAHAGDIEGVLVDHAADMVMFDVPPPENGARGIDAFQCKTVGIGKTSIPHETARPARAPRVHVRERFVFDHQPRAFAFLVAWFASMSSRREQVFAPYQR